MIDFLKYCAVYTCIHMLMVVALVWKGWFVSDWMVVPTWFAVMWILHGTDLDMRVQRWFDTFRKRPAEAG